MKSGKSCLVISLCALLASPAAAQTTDSFTLGGKPGFWNGLVRPYQPHLIAPINFEDSSRIGKLIRAGNIYLSLRDAIALALENNLDLELARIQPKLNVANLQRAQAGQLLRTVSSNISSGPSSATLGVLAGNAVGNTGGSSGNTNNGILSGLSVQLAGSTIPNLDPTFFSTFSAAHQTVIETSTVVTGTTSLQSNYRNWVAGVQQGYWTGTTAQLFMSSTFGLNQNAPTALFNPVDQGSLNLSITQNLLNGFGLAVNKRALNQAKNNLKLSDSQFKQQVMATVSNVVNLYWDLVSFNDALKVRQQTLDLDTHQFEDNKRRADLGAIAPIDTITFESEMTSAQQDVYTQESQVLNQEAILKSVLTRGGLDNPVIMSARIIPTDHVEVPAAEPVRPVQDLVAEAIQNRPEIFNNQISLENARLNLLGTKSNLLPTLSANLTLSNSGQAGSANSNGLAPVIGPNGTIIGYRPLTAFDVNGYFLGGYGTVLSQIFGRNFPNYSASLQLTVPLRNRAAQADLITDELNYRQSEIQDRQLRNNIKLSVINATTAVQLQRRAFDTAVVARQLQDQTLAGSRRRYELGSATILDVLIAQRDATTRQLAEVDARRQYIEARTSLQQQIGTILDVYNVDLGEAKNGQVKRDPDLTVVNEPAPAKQ